MQCSHSVAGSARLFRPDATDGTHGRLYSGVSANKTGERATSNGGDRGLMESGSLAARACEDVAERGAKPNKYRSGRQTAFEPIGSAVGRPSGAFVIDRRSH
jgi:hypothetical protein